MGNGNDNTQVPVKLHVKTSTADGYTQAKNASGVDIDYYYKFTGGNTDLDNGKVIVTAEGETTDINVSLDGDSNGGYDIKEGVWKAGNAAHNDITFTSNQKNRVTLEDTAANDSESVNYTVVANPKNATTPDIYCDPMIQNNWN